jgi:hypothetical protein
MVGETKMFTNWQKKATQISKQIKWINSPKWVYWPKTYGCVAWDCGFPWAHKWLGTTLLMIALQVAMGSLCH